MDTLGALHPSFKFYQYVASTTSFWFRPLSQTLNPNIQLPIKQLLVEQLIATRITKSHGTHNVPGRNKTEHKSVIPSVFRIMTSLY